MVKFCKDSFAFMQKFIDPIHEKSKDYSKSCNLLLYKRELRKTWPRKVRPRNHLDVFDLIIKSWRDTVTNLFPKKLKVD